MSNPSSTILPHSGLAPAERSAAPVPHAPRIAVAVRTEAEAFAEIAPAWNRLHAEAATASVFNSWIWQFQWWQTYGRGQPLRLLVASEGDQVVGILPLYLHRVRVLGVPLRLLRLVGTGGDTHPDDLGPILEPGRATAAAQELARVALELRGADVLLLTDLSPHCPFGPALDAAARRAGRAAAAGPCERIAFARLPASWGAYLERLSKHRRSRLRYTRRRCAGAQGRFFVWKDAATVDAAFDRLADLHRRRWAGNGGSESFASDEYLKLHRSVIKACLPRGWLRLYCLEVGGEIAAMIYAYRFRNTVYFMQSGFDPACARLEPGNLLLGHALEHAIGEGNAVFDFLRGNHGYKDQLATDYRTTTMVRVFSATPGALAYRLRRIWLPLLKARLLRRPAPKLRP